MHKKEKNSGHSLRERIGEKGDDKQGGKVRDEVEYQPYQLGSSRETTHTHMHTQVHTYIYVNNIYTKINGIYIF